jgi:hypothetical protein
MSTLAIVLIAIGALNLLILAVLVTQPRLYDRRVARRQRSRSARAG